VYRRPPLDGPRLGPGVPPRRLRDIVAEPLPIALPPAIHRQLVAPALAAAVETGTLEAHAYQHWLAAARDAERGGYHSDTFVGMVVSARKPGPGRTAITR
jgi:hypothetical protein